MSLISKVSHQEWRFVVFISVLVIIITIIPLVVGYLRQNADDRFVGFLNPHEDMNAYLSLMKQGRDGHILFESKYILETPLRNLFLPYFLLVGMLSRYLHVPLVIMHHIIRVICGFVLLSTSYLFCAYFINNVLKRKVAFILICTSSGFGFVFSCLYHFFGFRLPAFLMVPVDQVHPQAITFWGIDWFAHAELSIAMMLFVFLLILESYRRGRTALAVYAGLITAISVLILPIRIFGILAALSAYSLYAIFRDKEKRTKIVINYLVLLIISFLGTVPYLIEIITQPTTRIYFTHAVLYDIFGYLLGVGLVGFLAIWVMFKIVKEHIKQYYFLVAWAITVFLFLESPIGFRMRMVEGFHIALSILSTIGVFWLADKWGWLKNGLFSKSGKVFIALFVILSSTSNLMHFIVDIRTATKIEYPYFLSRDLENVYSWMDKHLSCDKITMSSREVGSFIPARAGLKAHIGHGDTLNRIRKQYELKQFMDINISDEFRIELLKGYNLSYFIFSDFERKLGDFNPDKASYLKEIYRSGSVTLYQAIF